MEFAKDSVCRWIASGCTVAKNKVVVAPNWHLVYGGPENAIARILDAEAGNESRLSENKSGERDAQHICENRETRPQR